MEIEYSASHCTPTFKLQFLRNMESKLLREKQSIREAEVRGNLPWAQSQRNKLRLLEIDEMLSDSRAEFRRVVNAAELRAA